MDQNDKVSSRPEWAPETIDLTRPSIARIYDYLLGGYHNFEIDRKYAKQAMQIFPDTAVSTRVARAFLRRAIKFVAAEGIDQFLELGSGIPTLGHVHEIARKLQPNARVAYVDIDPVAVAHSEAILADVPDTCTLQADIRQVEYILDHEKISRLIDFNRPVSISLALLLHFVPDDEEMLACVKRYVNRITSGSYLIISHGTYEDAPKDVLDQFRTITSKTPTPSKYRYRAEIAACFDGLELVEPGLVHAPLWRPETPDDPFLDQPGRSMLLVGVARKP